MNEKTTLETVIQSSFHSFMEDVHTCIPGEVNTFDGKIATVKPLIKKVYIDKDVLELPVLVNVPVMFPRTQRSGITFPIKRGDGVLILICERSLERWKSSGSTSEPGDPRRFDLSDAIAIPGLYAPKKASINPSNSDLEVTHESQTITIKKNGDIEIGGSSLRKLVTDDFKSIFDNHVHNVSTAGTAAAQAGITSSPAKLAGTEPVNVPAAPNPVPHIFGDPLPNSALTQKVTAQ